MGVSKFLNIMIGMDSFIKLHNILAYNLIILQNLLKILENFKL